MGRLDEFVRTLDIDTVRISLSLFDSFFLSLVLSSFDRARTDRFDGRRYRSDSRNGNRSCCTNTDRKIFSITAKHGLLALDLLLQQKSSRAGIVYILPVQETSAGTDPVPKSISCFGIGTILKQH